MLLGFRLVFVCGAFMFHFGRNNPVIGLPAMEALKKLPYNTKPTAVYFVFALDHLCTVSHISNMWTSNKFARLFSSLSYSFLSTAHFFSFFFFVAFLSKTCHYYFISFFSRCLCDIGCVFVCVCLGLCACVLCALVGHGEKKERHTFMTISNQAELLTTFLHTQSLIFRHTNFPFDTHTHRTRHLCSSSEQ